MKVYSIVGNTYEVEKNKHINTSIFNDIFKSYRKASQKLVDIGYKVIFDTTEDGEPIDIYLYDDKSEDVISVCSIHEHTLIN